eukprot:10450022-Alexandrium_andersonii.AAC.1
MGLLRTCSSTLTVQMHVQVAHAPQCWPAMRPCAFSVSPHRPACTPAEGGVGLKAGSVCVRSQMCTCSL